jgi:hypothetical protein
MDLQPVSPLDRVVLDRLKVSVCQHISPSIAETVEIRTWTERLTEDLVYELRAHVLAQRLPTEQVTESTTIEGSETVTWTIPATWWDHWKADHAESWWAGWFVRLRPPRTAEHSKTMGYSRDVTLTVDLRRYRTFPEADYVPPAALGRPVMVALADPPRWGVW